MEEPMVTIPLKEYNELRDKIKIDAIILERLHFVESRLRDLDQIVTDLQRELVNKR